MDFKLNDMVIVKMDVPPHGQVKAGTEGTIIRLIGNDLAVVFFQNNVQCHVEIKWLEKIKAIRLTDYQFDSIVNELDEIGIIEIYHYYAIKALRAKLFGVTP